MKKVLSLLAVAGVLAVGQVKAVVYIDAPAGSKTCGFFPIGACWNVGLIQYCCKEPAKTTSTQTRQCNIGENPTTAGCQCSGYKQECNDDIAISAVREGICVCRSQAYGS